MKNPLSWYVEKADANVLNDRQDLIELTRFVINACTEQNADFSLTRADESLFGRRYISFFFSAWSCFEIEKSLTRSILRSNRERVGGMNHLFTITIWCKCCILRLPVAAQFRFWKRSGDFSCTVAMVTAQLVNASIVVPSASCKAMSRTGQEHIAF